MTRQKQLTKQTADVAMAILLPLLMMEILTGQELHEWLGIAMIALFVVYHLAWNAVSQKTEVPAMVHGIAFYASDTPKLCDVKQEVTNGTALSSRSLLSAPWALFAEIPSYREYARLFVHFVADTMGKDSLPALLTDGDIAKALGTYPVPLDKQWMAYLTDLYAPESAEPTASPAPAETPTPTTSPADKGLITISEGPVKEFVSPKDGVTYLAVSSTGTTGDVLAYMSTEPGSSLQITNKDGSLLPADALCATGQTLQVVTKDGRVLRTLPIAIAGDVTGTGKISLSQLVRLATAATGRSLLTDAYLVAGDITGDGAIGIGDLVRVAKMLVAA